MCFSAPKPPAPPPLPTPPSARDEGLRAQQDEVRRKRAEGVGKQATILTSPLGDAGFGQSITQPRVGGTSLGG